MGTGVPLGTGDGRVGKDVVTAGLFCDGPSDYTWLGPACTPTVSSGTLQEKVR